MQDASPPCFVLDLNKSREGHPDCFLMGYKRTGGKLADLALVSGSAVYSTNGVLRGGDVTDDGGLKKHVQKPASKKMLTPEVHLGKVIAALEAVAACSSGAFSAVASAPPPASTNGGGAGSGSGGSGSSSGGAVATLEVETSDKFAVLTVKEALRIGAVVLATVKLPAVEEATGEGKETGVLLLLRKLLLGSVREAHRRAREAEEMRRDRARAREEHLKVQRLLDSAIRDKRKTVSKILEGATLVINAKKVRIEHLQDEIQRLEEEDGDSGGSGGSEDDDGDGSEVSPARAGSDGGEGGVDGGRGSSGDADHDEERASSRTNAKGKGRAAPGLQPAADRVDSAAAARAGASAGETSKRTSKGKGKGKGSGSGSGDNPSGGPITGGRSRGDTRDASGTRAGGKIMIKTEPTRSMGAGGGALAAPFGTQEVSGEDLLQLVDASVKSEAKEVASPEVHTGRSQKGKGGGGGGGGGGSVGGGRSTGKRLRKQSSSARKRPAMFDESDDDDDARDSSDSSDSDDYGGAGQAKKELADTDDSESDGTSTRRKPRRRRLKRKPRASPASGTQASGGGAAAAPGSAGTSVAKAGSGVNGRSAPPKVGFSWMAMAVAAEAESEDNARSAKAAAADAESAESEEEDLSGMK